MKILLVGDNDNKIWNKLRRHNYEIATKNKFTINEINHYDVLVVNNEYISESIYFLLSKSNIIIIFFSYEKLDDNAICNILEYANDYIYIENDIDVIVLISKIRAKIRRVLEYRIKYTKSLILSDIEYDKTYRKLTKGNSIIYLTFIENEIFALLSDLKMKTTEEIISCNYDISICNNSNESSTRIHISRLRKKLKKFGLIIKNKNRLGYILEKV